MIRHAADEDLILLFYRRLDPRSAARVESHIAACATCRAELAELGEVLECLDTAGIPEPSQNFEGVMWARVSQTLPRSSRWSWRQLVPLTVLGTATVALLIAVGTQRPGSEHVSIAVASESVSPVQPVAANLAQRRVLFTALDEHLAQTEVLLVELMNAPAAGELALQFERESAGELVASGRLYRATARNTRDGEFALVLEDIERVLVEVARSPAQVGLAQLESWRGRIADDDLLFKVRAAASEVRMRQRHLRSLSEAP